MNKSETIIKLTAALVKAQAEIKHSEKDGKNPHFKTEYSTLASVIDACKDALNKNGIAVIQSPLHCETGILLETTLAHESGEWLSSELYIPVSGNAQQYGSALTYARRYSLASMAMVAPDDDDANEAATPTMRPQVKRTLTKDEMSKRMLEMPDEIKNYVKSQGATIKSFKDAAEFYAKHDWDVDKLTAFVKSQEFGAELAKEALT